MTDKLPSSPDDDLGYVLSTTQGRRALWRLIDGQCGTVGPSFTTGGGVDSALVTAFNEGRRSIGIELMQQAQRIAPKEFLRMLAEEFAAREERAAKAAKAEPED